MQCELRLQSCKQPPCGPIHAVPHMQSHTCNLIHAVPYMQSHTCSATHAIPQMSSHTCSPIHAVYTCSPRHAAPYMQSHTCIPTHAVPHMQSHRCSPIRAVPYLQVTPASSLKILDQIILGMADVDANASTPPCCLQQHWVPHLGGAITSGVN
jgi:hypothetical protein